MLQPLTVSGPSSSAKLAHLMTAEMSGSFPSLTNVLMMNGQSLGSLDAFWPPVPVPARSTQPHAAVSLIARVK